MLSKINFLAVVSIFAVIPVAGQTPAPASTATVWNALSAPSMDASKSARAENVSIVRDAVHITLTDGTIHSLIPRMASSSERYSMGMGGLKRSLRTPSKRTSFCFSPNKTN